MVFTKAVAIAAIFATLTAAAPVHQKRAVVYETVTEVDVTTIDTTITVFPGEPTPTVPSVYTTEVAVTSTPTPPAVSPVVPTSTVAPAPAPVAETASSPTAAPPAPAPETTTAAPAPPAPTTTVAPPPPPPAPVVTSSSSSSTSTAPPPAAPTGTSGSSGSGPSGTGDGTFYDTATSLSAPSYCDTANDGSTENVVALSQAIMNQSLCGAKITVTYDGKTATGIVVDKCMGCDAESIDMSRAMFGELASLDAGRITVSWSV